MTPFLCVNLRNSIPVSGTFFFLTGSSGALATEQEFLHNY